MRVLRSGGRDIYVWRNMQLVKSRAFLFFVLLVAGVAMFFLDVFPYAAIGVLLIPVSFVLGWYSYRSYLTWVGGFFGEEAVLEALGGLEDSYVILNGLVVPPNRGDTDHIVIGPNGFFVIESKNYGGRISCDGDVWRKTRLKHGVVRELEVGSPSNQVKRNAKVLKDFLLLYREEIFPGPAPHLWVHGILVFTHPDAELELMNPTVDIVELDDLCDFIRSSTSEFTLSRDAVDAAGKALLKYAR